MLLPLLIGADDFSTSSGMFWVRSSESLRYKLNPSLCRKETIQS